MGQEGLQILKISAIKELLAGQPTAAEVAALAEDSRVGVQRLLQAYAKRQAKLAAEKERLEAMCSFEKQYYAQGAQYIAGVDEAGRGPLAGPLTIAAVILPPEARILGLNDSKQLSAKKREQLYEEILQQALAISVNIVSVSNIDSKNIYRATQQGMSEVLLHLKRQPQVALIDAMPVEAGAIKTVSLVHGDARSLSIAAASIIAKVTRDRIMDKLAVLYPEYAFEHNKGYGSQKHLQALEALGATRWHRRSYEPVKSMGLEPVEAEANILYAPQLDSYTYEPQK